MLRELKRRALRCRWDVSPRHLFHGRARRVARRATIVGVEVGVFSILSSLLSFDVVLDELGVFVAYFDEIFSQRLVRCFWGRN